MQTKQAVVTRMRSLALAGAVFMTLTASTAEASDAVIRIGVIQPQAGDCAQWGIPTTRGAEMWADEQNAAGGLLAGDGKRYRIEIKPYDNICYIPGEELKAARRAILDDGVQFIMHTFTPASRKAISEIVTDKKVLSTSYGAGYLNEKYPYLIGGMTGTPDAYMYLVSHMIEKNPKAKRIAIITSDNSFGLAAKAYFEAGIAPHVDQVEIVYNQSYDPAAASDLLGLLTPLMATKPDMIVELGFIPTQKAAFIETAEQLGFTGLYGGAEWSLEFVLQRVKADRLAGRLYSASGVEASEPTFSRRAHEMYKKYLDKYGQKEWSVYASIGYAAMGILEAGLKMSPTADAEAVTRTLYQSKEVDHPIFGTSTWGGKDIFGTDHHLLTPVPVYNLDKQGKTVLEDVIVPATWWAEHRAEALPKLAAGGQLSN